MNATAADASHGPELRAKVRSLMGGLIDALQSLVKIRSVYGENGSLQGVDDAAGAAQKLLKDSGLKDAELKSLGEGEAKLVYAQYECAGAPPGTPMVLLYAHYDVQPPGDWGDTAFRPVIDAKARRMTGRGAADDKSGVVMHAGAVQAFDGKPPVHLRVVLEGEEETGREALENYAKQHRELFTADVIVIADTGNHKIGEPTFTTSLRGVVEVDVTVSTLKAECHSGMYGGPAPDAFMALVRILARLHDDDGNVTVPGLVQGKWTDLEPEEKQFRSDAGVLDGVKLIGTGSLGSRLYTKPSLNVVGLKGVPPMDHPANQLRDTVTARVGMRIAPQEDPQRAVDQLTAYLKSVNPWKANVDVQVSSEGLGKGKGFQAETRQPRYEVARQAMEKAYPGTQAQHAGQGGSIPLASLLQEINPKATVLLIGCEEPLCRIHATGESVSLDELESMTLAESYLLQMLAVPAGADVSGSRCPQ
ncbi:M20/M25/M40 family metallo-hydrolase [Streptomyces natalensis]|uniref:M20/M25/M40 family metallo-hydrolase n=1 Tax=Streptomyces natalensis TaxID=68242 RepID=UPI0005C90BCD|nr:M20/M25/M40 family metallo-hydrolase [Streptomyces natalensis]